MAVEQPNFLLVGGLVAVGFDRAGQYILTVSHSGRGVFSTRTWTRVARDPKLAYPEDGFAVGIGPIDGEKIAVAELDSDHEIDVDTPDGSYRLHCASDGIRIELRAGT